MKSTPQTAASLRDRNPFAALAESVVVTKADQVVVDDGLELGERREVGEGSRVPEASEREQALRPAQRLDARLRAITGYEEELLEGRRFADNSAALCNELIARCLVPPGAEPGRARELVAGLSVAERDLALVALRRLSFGDRVETLVDCPRCGETSEIDFDLGELSLALADLPERLELRLADGRQASLRLPSAGDQAELIAARLDSPARRRSWLLARALVRLGDDEAPFDVEVIHALPSALRRQLEQALDEALPDFDLGVDVCCSACGHEFAAPFEIDGFFLLS
ncbi:hypothetical protein G6O69_04310 [Pseudenhygromyxa sp. WMMC2535]|uniref:T4 family baseplate hub assembly chaperone n=1 Tax=Pseudenhygromyxa sp. WMMC2535 TaxID=2712867 RepID=UPI001552465F|nr:hypothetical protein [Pseudenhygromyxa sp. WMMC2535]NVB37041.1 hypothetical protein [Pseudenhygromyxa sp. WMMC2535]